MDNNLASSSGAESGAGAAGIPDSHPVLDRPAPGGSRRGGRPVRRLVLVVDDEPLVLMTVKTLLEHGDTEVLTAVGGEDGLRLTRSRAAEGRKLDVVVSGWLMPRVGGAEIAQAARDIHPGTRVILLAGLRPEAGENAELMGAVDGIVAKPVRAEALRRAVEGPSLARRA